MARIAGALATLFLVIVNARAADPYERVVESVVPALAYGATCWSTVEVQNLGDRVVSVDVEGHRATGALVALGGTSEMSIHLNPTEHREYKLQILEETTTAWVKVRERIPSPRLSPVIAVSATTECVTDNRLHRVGREVAYPIRNPHFSEDVSAIRGEFVSMINTSEHMARALACYSSGSFFSVPGEPKAQQWNAVCSTAIDVQVPPFGSRQFPVEHDGNSHFSLVTTGEAVVLQMLQPAELGIRTYIVDSTVKFEGEDEKR